jgi:hypothetical protein
LRFILVVLLLQLIVLLLQFDVLRFVQSLETFHLSSHF